MFQHYAYRIQFTKYLKRYGLEYHDVIHFPTQKSCERWVEGIRANESVLDWTLVTATIEENPDYAPRNH